MNDAPRTARRLLGQVRALREEVALVGETLITRWHPLVADTAFRKSAQNLAHYLALRRKDLRTLQQALSPLGVSSLGRCEAHVLPTLDAVLATLGVIAGADPATLPPRPSRRAFAESERTLARQAVALLGPVCAPRSVRIMVTLPTEAAAKPSWVRKLLEAGADCVRVNCAHDEPATWMKMIRNVRAAASARGRSCKILMDLTGPRARTQDVLTPAERTRVQLQDRILLTRRKPAPHPEIHFQARCSLPDVFAELKSKRLVCFNEGRIRAQVERITPDGAELRVVAARARGEKFRSDMALNFPGTDLHIPPLTEKDLADLDFIVRHADLAGYSFVQRPEDISALLGELDVRRTRFGRKTKITIVAKIETAQAVQSLPEIIVRAAGRGPFGVMIARGDLAVEVGYLRVAEL